MSGEYNVDESGYATLPMLGRVEVADRDPRELRESLMEGYATQLRDPEIEITFLRRVAILGGVRMPGLYLLDPTMRLADAVALAEGASATGDIQKTKVLRNGTDVTSEVSLSAPLMSQLESGDEIYVPERSWLQRNGVVLMATLISAAAIIYAATIR
jgi:polysaccharide export outer membrane protein